MFVINITYKKSIEEVDKYLVEHRKFLDEGYKQNFLIASGPKNPRIGGIILSQLTDLDQLQSFIQNDPFLVHDVAYYDIIEFEPVKYHQDFAKLIENK